MELISLFDKQTGENLIDSPSCYLDLIEENRIYRMGAWRVGPYMKCENLNRSGPVRFTGISQNGIRSLLSYEIKFGESLAQVEIILKKDSPVLEFKLNVDWSERPANEEMNPQLRFSVPVSYQTNGKSICDIPYGEIERPQLAHDIPALSYMGIGGTGKHIVGLVTDTKYGFRLYGDVGSVTLLRSTNKPDTAYGDRGIHDIRIGIIAADPKKLKEIADRFNHPLSFVSASLQTGTLPLASSPLRVEGDAVVSCFKCAEDGTGDVIRLYNTSSTEAVARIVTLRELENATLTDTNENPLEPLAHEKNSVTVKIPAYGIQTVKLISKNA